MARGQQKIQSQQKNAKKASDKKKGQAADQKIAAKAALIHTCPVCMVSFSTALQGLAGVLVVVALAAIVLRFHSHLAD